MSETVGELLGRCLLAAGATRVFGGPDTGVRGIPGLGHVLVDDADLAALFADASGRLGRGPGVALLPGRRLRLSSKPGGDAVAVTITDPAALPSELASWDELAPTAAVELTLDVDLDAPAPAGASPLTLAYAAPQEVLAPSMAELRIAVVAGPGVVRANCVGGLRDFAAMSGRPVLNTFGAKGVFVWSDPHHGGTIGLQERDVELSGLADADVIIATGIDPDESSLAEWLPHANVLEVHPQQLAGLAVRWPEPAGEPERPALYAALAERAGRWYESDAVPLHPARAARDLSMVRRGDAVVVGEPGPAGLWLARTFPTTEPGTCIVPATTAPGIAAAIATVAALDGRPAVAVGTAPFDPVTEAVLERANAWQAAVVMCEWGADAPLPRPEEHRHLLRLALEQAGERSSPVHVPVPVDLATATRELVEVAGPVTAWTRRI